MTTTNENAKKLAIPREKFEAIIEQLGLKYDRQSGFHKVHGPEGLKLYVANGKTTNRVDLSGWTSDFGTKTPDQGVFGNVKQQMAFAETEEETLRTFGMLCEKMKSLPPVEPKPKKAPKAKAPKNAGEEVVTASVADTVETKAARKARLDLIKKVAESKGVPVSAETLALENAEPAVS